MKKLIQNKIKPIFRRTFLRKLIEFYRHRDLRENDIFLVSYQNSGSTWLRNLIYESITGKNPLEENTEKEFPFVGKHKNTTPIINGKRRIIKGHSPYRKEYRGKKIIYLVRDPRDIVVSKYHKAIKEKWKIKSKDDFLDKFIKGKIMSEGHWDEHVKSWLDAKKQGKLKLHIIRYKDLKKNTEKELKKIIDFLNLERDKNQIKKSIEDNKIEKMRKINPHARKGKAENWKEELNKEQAKKIENKFWGIMNYLGYLKD